MYTLFSVTFSFCYLICMLKSAPFLLIVFKLLELVLCTCYCLRRDLPNLVVFLPLNWHFKHKYDGHLHLQLQLGIFHEESILLSLPHPLQGFVPECTYPGNKTT